MPNPSLVRREKGLARHTVHQLLHVDVIRFAVAAARFLWFTRVRGQVRTYEHGREVATHTVFHNLKGLRDLAVNRALYLTRPLSTLESLHARSNLLVLGPRTEGEILGLVAHGFERRNIRALDLISYSPWVELGDMHQMPFDDDSFDAVIAGWVLAYSSDRARAAGEILRVVRPGGIVAIGVEWNPRPDDEIVAESGYLPGSDDRLGGCDEIIELFQPHVDAVLVREDPGRGDVGAMIVIFAVAGAAPSPH